MAKGMSKENIVAGVALLALVVVVILALAGVFKSAPAATPAPTVVVVTSAPSGASTVTSGSTPAPLELRSTESVWQQYKDAIVGSYNQDGKTLTIAADGTFNGSDKRISYYGVIDIGSLQGGTSSAGVTDIRGTFNNNRDTQFEFIQFSSGRKTIMLANNTAYDPSIFVQ